MTDIQQLIELYNRISAGEKLAQPTINEIDEDDITVSIISFYKKITEGISIDREE